ncbi:acyl-CoA dehydrogenase [Ignavibacteria bacterium CHB1]|nr:MAG: acyl-CoA dehydrogenase [Chlorobiota bacterium]MBV6399391.1 Acyl-CoA dehydrogenase, short-chain specific [Ignavibacteria bacterium]MCC6886856.1 acyl-CoA dehydrogenase family protein [Ignavibacteriales bacterium]MCE7953911.1 acyl-CoA dehydrogenase [Chlorobi bacterium CHB7]MDL1887844.1 acyl-CoA dehydrogenase [Ignavibacteria bacterium CHB1]RIK47931.1 MAG: acyl-CoA dehydrogenase [Ignavibacteriota bacterium]
MNFKLTERELEVQKLARDFAQNEIAPVVMDFDESQEFPMEIAKKLGDIGFLGIIFPEEYGGSGFSITEYAIIIEEISKVDPSMGLTIAAHNGLCTNHIYSFSNDDLKKKYLPDLTSGNKLGAWGLTENVSGSDAGAMATTAERRNGHYVLNGSKIFITHGNVGETAVVMAVTDKSLGNKGISAFIVEKGWSGFKVGKKENKLGMRASDTAELIFENLEVPAENLIGEEGAGFKQALQILDGGRIAIAALSVGIAQGAFEHSLKYSLERKQFGQNLSKFQSTQFKLSDMATEIEAARLLTYKAAYLKEHGKDINLAASMAKYFASEIATKATNEAIQIHGGYGFIKEFPVEKLYRDVKLMTIGEGTSEVQKLIIARHIINQF